MDEQRFLLRKVSSKHLNLQLPAMLIYSGASLYFRDSGFAFYTLYWVNTSFEDRICTSTRHYAHVETLIMTV